MNQFIQKYRATRVCYLCITGLVLVCVLVLSGCSDSTEKKEKMADRPKKAIPVTVGLSEKKTVPVALNAIGTVEPFATVAIKSQITGTLEKIHFSEGDDVKKGDRLFTIDNRPFTAMLGQAQGTLARDSAELTNARKELQRYVLAAGKGYVSNEQTDTAATKVATLAATVKSDEAAVESARLQLEFCSILSPIDGRTGELMVSEGNLIKANADDAMVTINQIIPIKVSFTVPGKNLPEIKKYQRAGSLQVLIPGIKGKPLAGTFAFIDNKVDTSTGTILLKATFANTGQELWPGQFVDVRMVLTSIPETVVVPTQAIQVRQDGAHIYVVRDDLSVEDRLVTTGMMVDGETVVKTGMQSGERVVTNGQLQLSNGVKVQERKEKTADLKSDEPSEKAGKPEDGPIPEQSRKPEPLNKVDQGKS